MTGKQNSEYFKEYYIKNKEKINQRNKEKYLKDRENPEKLIIHREKSLIATKKYREKNIDKCRDYSRERHIKRKKIALEKIGKGKAVCVMCGCDEMQFLEINHVNGGGCKEHRDINKGLKDSIINGKRSTDDLNVLCRVCNALDYLQRKNKKESGRFKIEWSKTDGK